MTTPKLYMFLLGATVPGRHTEQHDMFFAIGDCPADIEPSIKAFWKGHQSVHVDAWREVTMVDGFEISVVPRETVKEMKGGPQLYFLNLGGYKPGEFEEFHYKMLVVATDPGEAVRTATKTAFYKHYDFPGATSHVDNKYGVDVDELLRIADILPIEMKEKYSLQISPTTNRIEDELHLGYFKMGSLPG